MSFKHHRATAVVPVKLPKADYRHSTHMRLQACTHTHRHTESVCVLILSAVFAFLFSWDAKCRWDKSAACAQSQEELGLKSKHLYEYHNTQGTVEDERERE